MGNKKNTKTTMNCYAYPLIFEAVKSNNNNSLSVTFYDNTVVYICKKNDKIFIKDNKKIYVRSPKSFNFYNNKPIDKITIIWDKYGHQFKNIFDKNYFNASVVIQKAWKKYLLKK